MYEYMHVHDVLLCYPADKESHVYLQVESLQLLIGFVDHLDITEPEDMLEKDLQEIGQGMLTEPAVIICHRN